MQSADCRCAVYGIPSTPHQGNRVHSFLCMQKVASVLYDSLQPRGLYPARLLCPWDSPGKNTGVGCHARLQGILPTQGSNSSLLSAALAGEFFTTRPLSPRRRLRIVYLAVKEAVGTLSEILIPRPRACASLRKQLVPGRLGAAAASVLTGYPWPSGPGESSGHTGRTSCCRHGLGPRGRAPGARFLRREADTVTAWTAVATSSLRPVSRDCEDSWAARLRSRTSTPPQLPNTRRITVCRSHPCPGS